MIGGYQIIDLKGLDITSQDLDKETESLFKTDKVILLQNFKVQDSYMSNVFLHRQEDGWYSSIIYQDNTGTSFSIRVYFGGTNTTIEIIER